MRRCPATFCCQDSSVLISATSGFFWNVSPEEDTRYFTYEQIGWKLAISKYRNVFSLLQAGILVPTAFQGLYRAPSSKKLPATPQ